jgi:type I restriction enzyme, S subunit
MKPYPEYKKTDIEWVDKLPSHWKFMPLKYAAFVNKEALTEQVEEDFELQYIDIGNVNQLGLVSLPERMKFIDAPSRARRIIKKNDTIISTVRTYLKAVAFIDRDDDNLIASTGFATLTSINGTHPKYLYYLVSNQGFVDAVSACSTGVSYPAITATELARIFAWLPPLPEQQGIAGFLDHKTAQIDSLIAKKQRQIDLLQEQRSVLINQVVTKGLNSTTPMKDSGTEWLGEIPNHWRLSRLKFVCSLLRDGTHIPPPRQDDGIPLLSVRNIVNGKFINLSDDSLISIEEHKKLNQTLEVLENDVLLAIVGATLGKVAIVEKMEPFSIQRSLAVFRPKPELLMYKYLAYFFQSASFQSRLWSSVGFSAQPGIYLGTLENIHCPVPDMKEQINIVSFLEREETIIFDDIMKLTKQIELLREYRTALISETVTGKVDVRK